MRKLWNEFKSFAMSGNMLDLALGFIIGAAFATLVESLADNVLMQFVAAIFGKQDFTALTFTVNKAKIEYGEFLTDIINFLMLAAVLFLIIKFIVFLGVGRGRAFGTQQCPYCREHVAPNALVCKFCRQPLVDELPALADARVQLDEQNRRKIGLPVAIPGRRKATASQETSGGSGPGEGRGGP
jgi:large conductance mechanosensitive channel